MSPAPSPRNVLGLLGAFVATSVVAGLLAAGLAMPAVGASGVATRNSVNFFNSLPGDLKQPPLSERSTLLASDGSVITQFYEENRINVPLTAIAPAMQKAIVAIEDSRFYEHGGVDPKGLVRAFAINKISGHVEQGASTLTQQYVKNVLKETALAKGDQAGIDAAGEISNARKLKEIRYAVTLEKSMSKDEILDNYLNIAWFGGQINGVEAASRYYFRTTAAKLTLPQAATLAGMVQDPAHDSPRYHPANSVTRRNVVLARMAQLKIIDDPTYQAAKATKLGAKITPTRNGCLNSGTNAYFCDYVYNLIVNSPDFSSLGATEEDRVNTLLRGGLTIRTTLSPKINKAAYAAAAKVIPPKDKSQVAAAAVTIQPGTGKVLAVNQNKTYDPLKKQAGATSLNYGVDKEYGGSNGFQTGSSFKPFTLATWLKANKSLNASVPGAAIPYPYSDFHSCGSRVAGGTYHYSNSEGNIKGNLSVFSATAASVNGAYVAMERQLDLCDIRATAESLGVHLAAPRSDFCSLARPQPETTRLPVCIPSLTLGVADISPMTMAAAYAGFAAQGRFCKPVAVTSILDRNRKPLKVPGADCKQAMDKSIANTVTYGLSRVFSPGGTAAHVGGLPGRPASGKTGTTNASVNTWFVGYTPQLSTAVWVGDPVTGKNGSQTPLGRLTINGVRRSVFGATYAAPIWKKIMIAASAGMPVERFPAADAKLTRTPRGNIPNVLGRQVADAISALQAAGFQANVSGGSVASKYPAGTVAAISPSGSAEKGTVISISVSSGKGAGGGGGGGGGKNKGGGGGRGGGGGGGNNNAALNNLLNQIFPPTG